MDEADGYDAISMVCFASVGCATSFGCDITGTLTSDELSWDLFPKERGDEGIRIHSEILPSFFKAPNLTLLVLILILWDPHFVLLFAFDTYLSTSDNSIFISKIVLRCWTFLFGSILSCWSELNVVPIWLSAVTTCVLLIEFLRGLKS